MSAGIGTDLPAPPAGPSPTTAHTPTAQELDRTLMRSVAWTGAAKWLPQLISWPATIVIARILSPSDYGLVALVSVYMRFLALLSEAGIGAAIVVDRDLDKRAAAQMNSLSIMLGFGAFALSCAIAYPLRVFYKQAPGFEWVVITLSLVFVFESVGLVPGASLRRRFDYKTIAIASWAGAITDIAVELTMAVMGFGYWTLVVGYVANTAAATAVLLARAYPGFHRPDFGRLRGTLGLAKQFLSRSMAQFLSGSADVAVGGRIISSAGIGAYNVAGMLASVPVAKITSLVVGVTPALFATVSHDHAQMRRYVLLITEGLAMAIFPALVGLALVAPELVHVVLGDKWAGAVLPLQFLALHGAVFSVTAIFPQILQTTGRARDAARNGWLAVIVNPILFYLLGRAYGAPGLAAAFLVATPIVATPIALHSFRVIALPARAYLLSLWPALSGTAAMTVAVLAVRRVLTGTWPPAAVLAACVLTGAALYAAVTLAMHGRRLREAVALLRSARG